MSKELLFEITKKHLDNTVINLFLFPPEPIQVF